MTILIGGGTGFVGSTLAARLRQLGHSTRVITQHPKSYKDQISWTDVERYGVPTECWAVVNLAGQQILDPTKRWSDAFKQELYHSRIDTTKLLAKAVGEAHHTKVFVTTSAVGYYPASQTAEYTEDYQAAEKPVDFLQQLCVDWEKAAKLPPNSPVRQATVRIGVVLGRRGGVINSFVVPFWLGLGGTVGNGQQWFPWVHLHDVVGIFTHAIKNEKVRGTLNAVSPGICTNREFTKALGSALWRPAVFRNPIFNTVFGPERAKIMVEGQKVTPKRTLESGYKFKFLNINDACGECGRLRYSQEEKDIIIAQK